MMMEKHIIDAHQCQLCQKVFTTKSALDHHLLRNQESHRSTVQIGLNPNVVIKPGKFVPTKAFKGYLTTYRFELLKKRAISLRLFTVKQAFDYLALDARAIMSQSVKKFRTITVQISILVAFMRQTKDGTFERRESYTNAYKKYILNVNSVKRLYKESESELQLQIEKFEKYGSGWIVETVRGMDLRIGKESTFGGGCYVSLHPQVYAKKCVVNVANTDHFCFKWAILSILHPHSKNPNRVSSYTQYEANYLWDNSLFPMKLKNIHKFEEANFIAVNVFSWDCEDKLIPERISEWNYDKSYQVVNLLKIMRNENDFHYAGIRDLNRLLGRQNLHRREVCFNCLRTFSTKKILAKHVGLCKKFKTQKVKMPDHEIGKPKPTLKFQSISKQLKAGYVSYADFECIQVPEADDKDTKRHVPCGFAYIVVQDDHEIVDWRVYRNPDCVDVFFLDMHKWGARVKKIFETRVPVVITEQDKINLKNATHCDICLEELLDDRVLDHCHRTGKVRSILHGVCNLNLQQQEKLPIIMHGFRNYDSHFIVHGFKKYRDSKIEVIPTNSQKFMSIICDTFYFLDSYMFLNLSLANLVANLVNGCANDIKEKKRLFDAMYKFYANDERKVELMLRKGVFCYDFLDSFNKFKRAELPEKSKFFNSLTQSHISQDDYQHAKNVFSQFNCKNIGDFHDTYVMGDVLQLACVFENFRTWFLTNFRVDVVHYFSLPGAAWDSALLRTKVELELLVDEDKYLWLETGMRGGVSMICQRYAKANNSYLSDYDPKKPSSFLMYYDMVALYSACLLEPLPHSCFEWVPDSDVNNFDFLSLDDDGEDAAIIECSLSYPSHLHDKHSMYPLAADHKRVSYNELSHFQQNLLNSLYHVDGDDRDGVQSMRYDDGQLRLIPHLGPRKNFVILFRNLKYYLSKGLVLESVHKILKYKQRPWFKEFAEFVTELRKNAKNRFDDLLAKLILNACYGKSCENVRKRVTVKLVNELSQALKYNSKPNLKTWEILDDNLVYFVLEKTLAKLNKPIYTGFAVLELSKLFMNRFHYEKILEWYDYKKVDLIFTDTDSLCYLIQTNDAYADMEKHLTDFDTSNYPSHHRLFSLGNRKIPGKMKDEFGGVPAYEAVALSSKMYSIISEQAAIRKKACKGTKTNVIDKVLHHDVFLEYLHKQEMKYTTMHLIRCRGHKVFTTAVEKCSLHAFDRKRHICIDGEATLAHEHFRIGEKTCLCYDKL